jgi:uncharacterized protein
MSDMRDVSQKSGGPGANPGPAAHLIAWIRNAGRRHLLVLVGITAIGLGGLVASGCTSAGASTTNAPSCSPNSAKLTVQGTGQATGTPDTLTIDIATSTTQATAQEALADNNNEAAAVTAAFAAGGVTKQNIQTTGLSVQPNYTLMKGTEVLAGYRVNNTITAMITNLASAGNVIDAVSGAAGNAGQINSVSLSIKDPRDLEDQARTDAVHQAVSHAQTMAKSAGERLGPVCSLTDTAPTPQINSGLSTAAGLPQASAVPIEVGSQQASAQVTIVYSLKADPPSS